MNLRLVTAISALLLAAPAAAQEQMPVPKPAPELKRYHALVGTWKGEGTAAGTPGMQIPWTSTSTYQWILNGHVLLEQTRIEFDAFPPLFFKVMHCWNTETKQYMAYQVGNEGQIASHVVHWTDNKTMVYGEETMEMGQLRLTRWVGEVDGDTMQLSSKSALNTAPFADFIAGTMKRTSKKAQEVQVVEAAFVPMPGMPTTAEHMSRFTKMAGTYRMKGFYAAPGMGKADIKATEKIDMLFGNTVCQMHSKGDPHPMFGEWEGWAFFAWNDHDKCYDAVFANSMGECGKMQCRWINDTHAVSTFAGTAMGGRPVANSGTLVVDETGAITRHWGWMIIDAEDPMKVFDATYEKQN